MLYLVATPIGNLDDLSERALRVLRSAKAVYCEDTRRTRKLLTHYGIATPLHRYRERDEAGQERIVRRLADGEDIALTSDSGTPVISDPGLRLVQRARASGIRVCSVPGPCAATTAAAGSGLPADSFVFLGFLPRTPSKRRKALEAAAALEKTIVVYESPYRVLSLLQTAEVALGASAQAAVSRELSKVHEEWLTGTVAGLREVLASREKLMGEFVVLFHPSRRKG